MGAYAEFFRELYPKIRENYVKENGKIDSHEVARFTGAKWNALSESDKKVSPLSDTPPYRFVDEWRMSSVLNLAIRGALQTCNGKVQVRL